MFHKGDCQHLKIATDVSVVTEKTFSENLICIRIVFLALLAYESL